MFNSLLQTGEDYTNVIVTNATNNFKCLFYEYIKLFYNMHMQIPSTISWWIIKEGRNVTSNQRSIYGFPNFYCLVVNLHKMSHQIE